jgi:hypothetical protein
VEFFYFKMQNTQTYNDITVYLRPTGHALSNFWIDQFKKNYLNTDNITNSRPLNKSFSLHAWQTEWDQPDYSRNMSKVCDMLNDAIEKVNYFYGPYGYPNIDIHFSSELLKDREYFRSAMNDLHHHFELLIGQVGNVSDWFYKPNSHEACYYVTQLNGLLHEIEATINNLDRTNGQKCIYFTYTAPNIDGTYLPEPVRKPLKIQHYECFENVEHQWGMLTAFYSQLGKQHIEVFIDGDDVIGEENISGIQWMLGESNLSLGENADPTLPPKERVRDEFKKWLIDNGFDINDPTLALGLGVLARIHVEDNLHLGNDWQEIDTRIHECDDIYEVGFCDENLVPTVKQQYNYSWEEYRNQLIENIKDKKIFQ